MRSYGGVPGSEAAKGMGENDGGKGRSIRLVYIASFAAPKGTNLSDDPAPWIHADASHEPPVHPLSGPRAVLIMCTG